MATILPSLYATPFRLTVEMETHIKNAPWVVAAKNRMPTISSQHIKDCIISAAAMSSGAIQTDLKNFMVKEITDRYDISSSSLLSTQHRAKGLQLRRVSTTSLTHLGGVRISGNRLPVMRFNVQPSNPPVQLGIPINQRQKISISIRKGKIRTGVSNRFVAKMKSGQTGVFYRKNDGTRAIDEEFMLSMPEILYSKKLAPIIQRRMDDLFLRAFDVNIWRVKL